MSTIYSSEHYQSLASHKERADYLLSLPWETVTRSGGYSVRFGGSDGPIIKGLGSSLNPRSATVSTWALLQNVREGRGVLL